MTQIRKSSKPRPKGRTAVYRLFDAGGGLLYVGCSHSPPVRCKDHSKHKKWWPEVADRTEEWHGTRRAALRAEKAAIETEGPKYNICHTPLHAKVCHLAAPLSAEEGALWLQTWDSRSVGPEYGSDPYSCGYRAVHSAGGPRGESGRVKV